MNFDDALWNELNGIFLADEATDAAVNAYNAGDLTELGLIIAKHINRELAKRQVRKSERAGLGIFTGADVESMLTDLNRTYALTVRGEAEVRNARLEGGVL